MPDIRTELLDAMEEKAFTYASLKEASGITADLPALNRKLRGETELTLQEGLTLARVLKVRVREMEKLAALAEELGISAGWERYSRKASS